MRVLQRRTSVMANLSATRTRQYVLQRLTICPVGAYRARGREAVANVRSCNLIRWSQGSDYFDPRVPDSVEPLGSAVERSDFLIRRILPRRSEVPLYRRTKTSRCRSVCGEIACIQQSLISTRWTQDLQKLSPPRVIRWPRPRW